MAYRRTGGVTQQYYHTIPSSLDLITTTPTKQSIANLLAQISYKQFPEFILDILTKVFKHSKVDITDGQGDEQQDILTITPEGERCLTQCKHTIDTGSHYNGTDLDNMVTVCLRKNCTQAFFVTNGDLTPQGKKYITDNEYNRLLSDLNLSNKIKIDYWNDLKLWDLIKDNSDILNKWFSGMGQTTGLRNYKFEVTVQSLPYDNKTARTSSSQELIALLVASGRIKSIKKPDSYSGSSPSGITIHIDKWFQFAAQLDINYMLPDNAISFLTQPMYALVVEAVVERPGKFNPEEIRDEIITFLFDESLPALADGHWWHITSSPSRSFLFLYDVGAPAEIKLTSAKTYVKVGMQPMTAELAYISFKEKDFKCVVNDEDDEETWVHSSGFQIFQMFDQKLDPAEVYNHQLSQLHDLTKFESHHFFAANRVDNALSMRIRKILPIECFALLEGSDSIYWGFPPETLESEIDLIHKKLQIIGVEILKVDEETQSKIFQNVPKDMPPPAYMYITETSRVSFPVSLDQRLFCVFADIPKDKMDEKIATNLLLYKYTVETRHGFDNMDGKKNMNSHTSELPHLLSDIMTIRGLVMIDIGLFANPMKAYIRFRPSSLLSSNDLALIYIQEASKIVEDLVKIVGGADLSEVNYIS